MLDFTSINADLSNTQYRLELARNIKDDIDQYCEVTYNDGHRKHLGASLIGNPCSRYLWYVFRWVKAETHTGRQQRLFNRGKREEERYIEWLRGTGATVTDVGEDGKQLRVSACNGHFGGSLDGIVTLPTRYNVPFPLLAEYKTNGTGQGFNKLVENGVTVAKPVHYSQMSIYGKAYNLQYGAYFNINKNDDDLHVEIVKLDFQLAHTLENKANDIIQSTTAPAKYSLNAATFECKYCHFKDICHHGELPEKNCRSCAQCTPTDAGTWTCGKYGVVPDEYIPTGCGQWEPIR